MKKLFGLALAAVVATSNATPSKANELAVQGGSSTGGSQQWICGQSNGLSLLSVTGAWNDRVQVINCWGQVEYDCSIGELSSLPNAWLYPLCRNSSQKMRDGQTRVMLAAPQTPWWWGNGSVRLRRGGATIDTDPWYVW